jgi:hypothetical protein
VMRVTTSPATLACDLGQVSTTAHGGDTVVPVAEGAAARRQSAGVLLRGCAIVRYTQAAPSPAWLTTLPIPTASAGARDGAVCVVTHGCIFP